MAKLNENLYTELSIARNDTDKSPSLAKAKAGNYRKGKIRIHGLLITIENPKGSYRRGKDKNGHEWKTLMHNDYGYFNRTLGKDGDAVDVFLGPNLNSTKIFPIDQYNGKEYDETKIMMGFTSKEEAKAAYLSNYEPGWKGFKYITEVGLDTFKKWLYDGHRQRKPFAKYAWLSESKDIQFDIIQRTNPMLDDYHVGIRSVDNIKTFEEAMEEAKADFEEYGYYSSYPDTPNSVLENALKSGMITVYSSKPIENGNFVTTSKMCAKDYAGGGQIYSETLPTEDIAWINVEEGQVARTAQNTSMKQVSESKKQRKNDDGKNVPEYCSCGGKICLQIHGEPVFICNKCGKYYGTLPFTNESIDIKKALKRLKKRRDPANIENWDDDMINESQGLKSKKLYDIFKQYGRKFIAKHYDSSEAMDLHNVSDNDVVGVFKSEQLPKTEGDEKRWVSQMGFNVDAADGVNNIKLGKLSEDGQILYAVVINRNANFDCTSMKKEGGFKEYVAKKSERARNRRHNGSEQYQWKDNDVKFYIMNNPYRKDWGDDAKRQLQDKMKNVYGDIYNKVKNVSEGMEDNITNNGIDSIYTMDDWIRDGSIKVKEGQPVADEVVNQLKNDVPPATLSNRVFQVGEPYSHDWNTGQPLFMTFERGAEGSWVYKGLEPVRQGKMWESERKSGRKVYLTESQFKAYCRQVLREKRNEDYLKKLINENLSEIYHKIDVNDVYDEVKMAVEGAVDYLNNEGVISYQPDMLEHALDTGNVDYKDICSTALDYIEGDSNFSDEVRQLFQNYVNNGGSEPGLEDKINDAITEYIGNAQCFE